MIEGIVKGSPSDVIATIQRSELVNLAMVRMREQVKDSIKRLEAARKATAEEAHKSIEEQYRSWTLLIYEAYKETKLHRIPGIRVGGYYNVLPWEELSFYDEMSICLKDGSTTAPEFSGLFARVEGTKADKTAKQTTTYNLHCLFMELLFSAVGLKRSAVDSSNSRVSRWRPFITKGSINYMALVEVMALVDEQPTARTAFPVVVQLPIKFGDSLIAAVERYLNLQEQISECQELLNEQKMADQERALLAAFTERAIADSGVFLNLPDIFKNILPASLTALEGPDSR